jgi:hypothetical protein
MKDATYYAERLYTQAITDPSVNATDASELWPYIEQEADELFLDSEAVVREAKNFQADEAVLKFKQAISQKQREMRELREEA